MSLLCIPSQKINEFKNTRKNLLHKETHRYQFDNGELMELFLFIYLVYLTRGGSVTGGSFSVLETAW